MINEIMEAYNIVKNIHFAQKCCNYFNKVVKKNCTINKTGKNVLFRNNQMNSVIFLNTLKFFKDFCTVLKIMFSKKMSSCNVETVG